MRSGYGECLDIETGFWCGGFKNDQPNGLGTHQAHGKERLIGTFKKGRFTVMQSGDVNINLNCDERYKGKV
jgi:hypothetical protein